MRSQVAILETKVARLQAEIDQTKIVGQSTTTAPAAYRNVPNGGTYDPRPDSRASTIYTNHRSETPNRHDQSRKSSTGIYATTQPSVWDSIHAPRPTSTTGMKSHSYPQVGPTTPKARGQYFPPSVPSPTPSTVSLAPTQGEDGWWSWNLINNNSSIFIVQSISDPLLFVTSRSSFMPSFHWLTTFSFLLTCYLAHFGHIIGYPVNTLFFNILLPHLIRYLPYIYIPSLLLYCIHGEWISLDQSTPMSPEGLGLMMLRPVVARTSTWIKEKEEEMVLLVYSTISIAELPLLQLVDHLGYYDVTSIKRSSCKNRAINEKHTWAWVPIARLVVGKSEEYVSALFLPVFAVLLAEHLQQ